MHRNNQGGGKEIPPAYTYVEIYFLANKASPTLARLFFDHFSEKGWKNRYGKLISNWKVIAWQWVFYKNSKAEPKYP